MAKPKQPQKPERTCADCIHEWACQAWTHGTIHHMNATGCAIYETVKDSTAYFIGYMDGKKANCPNCGAKMDGKGGT